MRILKRNLAFVLVMAMAIGMMVSANAANVEDYRDANDIKFTEAVDVLSALGVLEGENGTFYPERVLTREEGAKIITYLMLGADGADSLNTSIAPFTDVAAGRWSAGFIAYCASQGIVGGYGNGTFGPTDTLTGTQFAKMLLVALGYGVNGEFTGANWEIETNKQALLAGVYDGNLGVNFSNGVKREEAAQYAFNTLTDCATVKYSDLTGAYYSVNVLNTDIEVFEDQSNTLGYQLYNLKKTANGSDEFGRTCHIWKSNAKVLTEQYHDEADAVYTDNVKSSKLYTDLGLTTTVEATVYVDSDTALENTYTIAKNNTKDAQSLSDVLGADANVGKGVIIEAYANTEGEDEEVTICIIHVYLAQVTDYDTSDEEVTVNVLVDGAPIASGTFETAVEYEEDDYVLVTVADGEIQSVVPAVIREGTVSSLSTNYVRFDGEQVNKAKYHTFGTNNIDVDGDKVNTDNEYNLIVDENGYALGLVLVEETESTTGYLYVNKLQTRKTSLLDGNAAVAEVRYLDGKGTEVLTLDTAKKTVGDEKNVLCYHVNGAEVEGAPKNWVPFGESDAEQPIGDFFAYSMTSDDKLVLTIIDKDDVKPVTGNVQFDGETTGTITPDGESAVEVRFNSKSVVNVIDDDDNIRTSTGYKNIRVKDKEGKESSVLLVYTSENSTLVKEAYILSSAKVGGNNDIYVYARGNKADFEYNEDEGWYVKLYTNSKDSEQFLLADNTDIDVLATEYDNGKVETAVKGLFVITVNSENEITEIVAADNYDDEDIRAYANEEVTDCDRNQFTTASGTHIYADECVILDATDGVSVGSTSSLKAATFNKEDIKTKTGTEVSFIENEDGEVVYLVVVKAAENVD